MEVPPLTTYRPEKAHSTQIKAFKELRDSHTNHKDSKLILLGSARNQDDLNRVEHLKSLAKSLGVDVGPLSQPAMLYFSNTKQSSTEFIVNASFKVLLHSLSTASIGINTMVDEHFGINVVEYMVTIAIIHTEHILTIPLQAAGLIPLAHASAGPLLDIIVDYKGSKTGG